MDSPRLAPANFFTSRTGIRKYNLEKYSNIVEVRELTRNMFNNREPESFHIQNRWLYRPENSLGEDISDSDNE